MRLKDFDTLENKHILHNAFSKITSTPSSVKNLGVRSKCIKLHIA